MMDLPAPDVTSRRNSRDALESVRFGAVAGDKASYLMFRSIALSGWTVAFRKKEHVCLYSKEKSDCDTCIDPLTVQRKAGTPCSFASSIKDMTLSKFDCQYMKASELMPRRGV
jgi:hypothetical protein